MCTCSQASARPNQSGGVDENANAAVRREAAGAAAANATLHSQAAFGLLWGRVSTPPDEGRMDSVGPLMWTINRKPKGLEMKWC